MHTKRVRERRGERVGDEVVYDGVDAEGTDVVIDTESAREATSYRVYVLVNHGRDHEPTRKSERTRRRPRER